MIPDSLAAFVCFLLLLAPGTVGQLQQARYEPSVKETALSEASRVVIWSLFATGLAAALLLPFVWLPLYRNAESTNPDDWATPTSPVPYIGGVAATSLLACGLVLLFGVVKWRGPAPISRGRQWNHTFVTMKPASSKPPFLTVQMLDDTIWKGELVSFDTDPEDSNRGLTLGPPLRRKRAGDSSFAAIGTPDPSVLVILTERDIKSIRVQFPKVD